MSYDIALRDPVTHEVIELDAPHFMQGGTYAFGGTRELWLNVTYNYGKFYRRPDVLGEKGIRSIYGMSGAESIPVLDKAIAALGDDTDPDYLESHGRERKASSDPAACYGPDAAGRCVGWRLIKRKR